MGEGPKSPSRLLPLYFSQGPRPASRHPFPGARGLTVVRVLTKQQGWCFFREPLGLHPPRMPPSRSPDQELAPGVRIPLTAQQCLTSPSFSFPNTSGMINSSRGSCDDPTGSTPYMPPTYSVFSQGYELPNVQGKVEIRNRPALSASALSPSSSPLGKDVRIRKSPDSVIGCWRTRRGCSSQVS